MERGSAAGLIGLQEGFGEPAILLFIAVALGKVTGHFIGFRIELPAGFLQGEVLGGMIGRESGLSRHPLGSAAQFGKSPRIRLRRPVVTGGESPQGEK